MTSTKQNEPIIIWRFYDAPQELRDLSTNGGDEDWIAVLPPAYTKEWILWMDEGTAFGRCRVDVFPHPSKEGYEVRIGCHG